MFTIKVLPSDKEIQIDSESTLLEAFKENDIYIKSTCGGYASCGCCKVKIIDGRDNLDKIGFPELQLLGNVFHITKERLACQTRITGDITVDTSVHDKEYDALDREVKTKRRPAPKAPARPLVRKKDEVVKVKEERQKEYQVKQKENFSWERHWEKKEENPELANKPKKLGGGKRPRPFSYRNDEVDFEKIKAENKAKGQANYDQGQDYQDYEDEGQAEQAPRRREPRSDYRPSGGAKAAYNPPSKGVSAPYNPPKQNVEVEPESTPPEERDFRKKRQQDDE